MTPSERRGAGSPPRGVRVPPARRGAATSRLPGRPGIPRADRPPRTPVDGGARPREPHPGSPGTWRLTRSRAPRGPGVRGRRKPRGPRDVAGAYSPFFPIAAAVWVGGRIRIASATTSTRFARDNRPLRGGACALTPPPERRSPRPRPPSGAGRRSGPPSSRPGTRRPASAGLPIPDRGALSAPPPAAAEPSIG